MPLYILRGGVMATYMCSRHELKVRFLSPAPIFFILAMFFLCVSAGAVSVQEDTFYDLSQFPAHFNNSSSAFSFGSSNSVCVAEQNSSNLSTTNSQCSILVPASSAYSGTFGTSSVNPTFFDSFDPKFRFIQVSFSYPRSTADIGFIQEFTNIHIFAIKPTATSGIWRSVGGYISNNEYTLSLGASSGGAQYIVPYAYTVDVANGMVVYNVYFALEYEYYILGLGVGFARPSGVSGAWSPNPSTFRFKVSSKKILPPESSSGGSAGDVDLSSITSQINALSAQMSSSFQQVNANIDSAESSISNSIDNQTTALEVAISDAAGDITTNFNNWDTQLSDAFSPADGQVVVDANTAVSGVHQIEADAVEDAGNQLTDVGIDSYSLPSNYKTSLSNMSYLLGLLFKSCSWITDLIIFSCTFGIAFVLIGRKSRGS